jgi:hypothetical protein
MSQTKTFKIQQIVNGEDCGLFHFPAIDSDDLQKGMEDTITTYEKKYPGSRLEMYYKGVWDYNGS